MESLKTSVSIVVNPLVRDMDLLPNWCSISVVEARENEVLLALVGWLWWTGGPVLVGWLWWTGGPVLVGWLWWTGGPVLVGWLWWTGGPVGEGDLPLVFLRSAGASSRWSRAQRGASSICLVAPCGV